MRLKIICSRNIAKNLFSFKKFFSKHVSVWCRKMLQYHFLTPKNYGYDFILIKKNHTLNCYSFFQKLLLKTKPYKLVVGNAVVSMVAQFTVKTINLEKVLISYSMNKLKFHILLTCKNFVFRLYVGKKIFAQGNGWWGGAGDPSNPVPISLRPSKRTRIPWLIAVKQFIFE